MSEPAAEAAPRRENVFTHKIGPLPMWGWVAIAGGGFLLWRWNSNRNAQQSAAQQSTAPDSTAANTVPQFVNQTYVSTTAPSSSDKDTGTAPMSSVPPPVNPSPVGSSTQPKPTTTLSGSWHYPAPTGLTTYSQSDSGIRLKWNAVTGPAGQHPNTYSVATYDSKGRLVNQQQVSAGNTAAAEYGPGGRGLAPGTYHTLVWANGGPVAPPGATAQYTISRAPGLKV